MKRSTSTPDTVPDALDTALESLEQAGPLQREELVRTVLSLVPPRLRSGRLEPLMEVATRFDSAGGFGGTPWEHPAHLRPRLWAGSFAADTHYLGLEALSTLRLVAVARGEATHQEVNADEARLKLERILSLNMDKLLGAQTEAHRVQPLRHPEEAQALLRFVLSALPRGHLLDDVAQEIDQAMAQRPVWTHQVRATLKVVADMIEAQQAQHPIIDRYVEAVLGPSPMAMRFRDPADYAKALAEPEAELASEAHALGQSLRRTGLACAQHGAFLRHVAKSPELLGPALGLDATGEAQVARHIERVAHLLETVMRPSTAQTAYGLARVLEMSLFERSQIRRGLEALEAIEIPEALEERLRASADGDRSMSGQAILLGAALRVLGQPLGVGQGNNPTCQAARGISLWAQYRPAHLLDLLASAARDDDVVMLFEGVELHSSLLAGGLAPHLDPELDPVSLVLVPHLDRLYDAMMLRATGRGADPHRWVNPALYGSLVPPGFSSCFEPVQWHIQDHPGFLRRFWATFHPEHNDGQTPLYAAPVGITVTDDRGRHMGLHAVSLQRVASGPAGQLRAYFYNPNNEGRQDWGEGVQPTVRDHGEREGESSLPFPAFASRVYAFHHPARLPGDPAAVPEEEIAPVTAMAKRTWGRAYIWD